LNFYQEIKKLLEFNDLFFLSLWPEKRGKGDKKENIVLIFF